MWQKRFEKYGSDAFTVVGLALDAEGVEPAKIYYERSGVTFPALVDPDYATQFGAVPKTFFIDEHGVIQNGRDWERQLVESSKLKPVTDDIRQQWTESGSRLDASAIAELARKNKQEPRDLTLATQLASRYLALGLSDEARSLLEVAVEGYDVKTIARSGGADSVLLGQAYFQQMRSIKSDRDRQTQLATTSYYLNPSIGFAKQIARIIAPERFDDRSDGRLDNPFREATYQRLKRQRAAWLAE